MNKHILLFILLLLWSLSRSYCQDADFYYKQGERLYNLSNYSGADQLFDQLKSKFPDHPLTRDNLYLHGWCAQQVKNYPKAVILYSEYTAVNPDGKNIEKALMNLGLCLVEIKKYIQALNVFNYLMGKYPNSISYEIANRNMGFCYQGLGDYTKAISIYQDYLTKGSSDISSLSHILYNQGLCYKEKKDFPSAISTFRDYLGKYTPQEPDYGNAVFNLGYSYQITFKYKDAVDMYLRYLSDYSSGQFIRFAAENLPVCEVYTIQTLKNFSSDSDVFGGLTFAQISECFIQLTTKVSSGTGYHALCLWYGETYQDLLGDYTTAIRWYTYISDHYPESILAPRALRAVATIYLYKYENKYNQYLRKEAEPYLDRCIGKYPTTWEASLCQYMKVAIRIKTYSTDSAILEIQKGLDTYGKDTLYKAAIIRFLFSLGNCSQAKQQWYVAIKYYQDIVDKYPEDPIAILAMNCIKSCNDSMNRNKQLFYNLP